MSPGSMAPACSFHREKQIEAVLSATRHFLTILPSFVWLVVPAGEKNTSHDKGLHHVTSHPLALYILYSRSHYSSTSRGFVYTLYNYPQQSTPPSTIERSYFHRTLHYSQFSNPARSIDTITMRLIIANHTHSTSHKIDREIRQYAASLHTTLPCLPLSMTIKAQVTFFMPGRKSRKAVSDLCLSSVAMANAWHTVLTHCGCYCLINRKYWYKICGVVLPDRTRAAQISLMRMRISYPASTVRHAPSTHAQDAVIRGCGAQGFSGA